MCTIRHCLLFCWRLLLFEMNPKWSKFNYVLILLSFCLSVMPGTSLVCLVLVFMVFYLYEMNGIIRFTLWGVHGLERWSNSWRLKHTFHGLERRHYIYIDSMYYEWSWKIGTSTSTSLCMVLKWDLSPKKGHQSF